MTHYIQPQAFVQDWPAPSPRYLGRTLPDAPALPLHQVFGEVWGNWIATAAEAKSAPPDYVVAGLLATVGTMIGNTRWVVPWEGWAEPPILWTMAIGSPSSNKSPALDAIMTPLKQVERDLRQKDEVALTEWRDKATIAKLAESAWKEDAKAALKEGRETPDRPKEANAGTEPHLLRLSIADGTVERLAVIVSKQPRGTLLARDELTGWLQGMTRYSGGGSDRPFWLEAYGGRSYTVERMGRDPVHIDRLSIGVMGGIQPDRLKTLLMKTDDDGLLARFLPIWPDPITLRRPRGIPDEPFIERALSRLLSLQMLTDEADRTRPWIVSFDTHARTRMDTLRKDARAWEGESEGLLPSFLGKVPGFAARLALVLAYLDWAIGTDMEPDGITLDVFERAATFIEAYAVPMARRAYADAAFSKTERAAIKLVALIREQGWQRFSTREVCRLQRSGLETASRLNPVLRALEEGDVLRGVDIPAGPQGGRPARVYAVNPAVFGGIAGGSG